MTSDTSSIYQNSLTSNRPAPRIDPEKKLQKQIQAVQKAIKKESQSGGKSSGILNGLKKSLRKLTAALTELEQKSKSSQVVTSSPETFSSVEKSSPQEPVQTTSPEAAEEEPPSGFREQSSDFSMPGQEKSATETTEAEVDVPIVESEITMADVSVGNGEKSQEKRESTSADHEMIDADKPPEYLPLTDECHHYTRRNQVDWDIQKYWQQRYSIFSLYDEGIHMTDDAWFGVTPEPVANKVATDLASLTPASKTVLIDMFAGAGGNVIAFALSNRWSTIIAIEKNPSVLACAQHNANIYGVFEQITWINDDSFTYLSSHISEIDAPKTVIFASPPWGGPGYTSDKVFNLNTMAPYSIKDLTEACKGMDAVLFLPRTSDLRQLAKLAPEGKKIEVVQYCMEGASKALVAYLPSSTS